MTNVVDYQPFANGSGANVESQAQFLTDLGTGGTLVNGYTSGLAKSTQFNKVARQSSMMAAALATFISTELNTSVLDDGNLAALTTNFTNALITLVAANAPQSTVYCGSAGGTANAIVLTPSPAVTTLVTGQMAYVFLVTAANTGATTVAISALPAKNLYKDGASGPTALTGGELQIGDLVQLRYDGTQFQLDGVASMASTTKVVSTAQSVASSNTGTYYVNTAAVTYTFAQSTVLGSNFVATIFAEGGAATIATNAGDTINGGSAGAGATIPKGFIGTVFTNNSGALYVSISPAGSGISTIASASTVDLGTAFSTSVSVTGTTTITSFGSSVGVAGPVYTLTFVGALTLTYNSTSMILPGKANIAVAAGDTMQVQYLGSGNWEVIDYQRASQPVVSSSMQGNFKNLKITVTSSSAITITADSLTLADGSGDYITVIGFSQSIATGTSGAGGLDTGSLAATSWYHVWAGCTPGGTPTAYISISSTAPTKPSTYTFNARIGAVRTGATAILLGTLQYGRQVQYVNGGANLTALPQMASGTAGNQNTPTWVAIATGGFVPPTASRLTFGVFTSSGAGVTMVAPSNSYGAYSSATNPPFISNYPSSAGNAQGSLTLESTNIYWITSVTSVITCIGWEDNL